MKTISITKTKENTTLNVTISGRLDSVTAPEVENELKDIKGIENLIIDFKNLDYISSAGLRILLMLEKKMSKQGNMVVKNPNEAIIEIFDVTGFSNILTIE